MKLRRKDAQITFGFIMVCLLVSGLLVVPSSGRTEPKLIPISECALNGFPLGGTIEQMRKALGEPESISEVMTTGNEYPHLESRYDGLRIVFSLHGRTALNYFVTSDQYRLRSGVGVGSTRQEIESALGSARYGKSGDVWSMHYHLAGPDGRAIPVQLIIRLDGDNVVEFSLISH
jgi:hypothetical protein